MEVVSADLDNADSVRAAFEGAASAFAMATHDGPDGPEDPLLAALGDEPTTLDALLARTGWPASELAAKLLQLELDSQVARLPGGRTVNSGWPPASTLVSPRTSATKASRSSGVTWRSACSAWNPG